MRGPIRIMASLPLGGRIEKATNGPGRSSFDLFLGTPFQSNTFFGTGLEKRQPPSAAASGFGTPPSAWSISGSPP